MAIGGLPAPSAVLDDACLLATELVSNSIRHAGVHPDGQIRVRAILGPDRLRVDVWDHPDGASLEEFVDDERPDTDSESGRGLYLVHRIADRWGSADGHHWFELHIPSRQGA